VNHAPETDLVGAGGPPVLIGCSHGTDNPAGRATVRAILADVRRARPDLDVREAFVDLQQPAVADAVGEATRDRGSAVVVPLLMSTGFHVGVDIAAAVAGRRATSADTLGPDDRLVRILVDRLEAVGARPGDAIVCAAAGSTDPRAAAAVERVVEGLRAAWPVGPVTVGYGSAALPRVSDAVREARRAGAERVVVASYLLAPGFFHDRLRESGADAVTESLAPDPLLVAIVLDRYAEAAARIATI
jgi:sirohydrochlorin ferrochelatase